MADLRATTKQQVAVASRLNWGLFCSYNLELRRRNQRIEDVGRKCLETQGLLSRVGALP